MRVSSLAIACSGLLLCACAGTNGSGVQPRNPFGVTIGAEDGNTFSATAAAPGDAKGAAASASTPVPALASAPPAAPARSFPPAPAPAAIAAAPAAPASGATRIVIDANAFAAVFGPSAAAVRPSATQLMQLDSLSLVAADAARVDLQTKILACRRAGDNCQLAGQ
jgi:hypothetical protein